MEKNQGRGGQRNPFLGLVAVLGLGLALSGCVSAYTIRTGISRDLKEYYTIYPSIEVDVVPITSDEAEEIKKGGVEDYFAPNSLRERINPFTVFFSDEHTSPVTLPSNAEIWKQWLEKKPKTLLIIASLPHEPDVPTPDPRMVFITMKRSFLRAKTLYFEVEPKQVVKIVKAPEDPQKDPAKGQEPKKPRKIIPLF